MVVAATPTGTSLRHLRVPTLLSAGLLVVAAVAGAAVAGTAGALGGAGGVLAVTLGYLLSQAAVAWADAVAPKLVMTVGLATYLLKLSLLGAVVFAVPSGWAGVPTMAVSMAAAVVTWVSAQVWWTMRQPLPAVARRP